jgi:hypothetical protein
MNSLRMLLPFFVLSSTVVLIGCREQAQPSGQAKQNPAQQNQAEQIAKPTRVVPASLTDPRNMLTIRPGGIDRCKDQDGVISVEVEWNATAAGTDGVHVYLQNPDEDSKLWTSAGAASKERTGEWLRDGSVVRLVNANDNQDLASITLKDLPCE